MKLRLVEYNKRIVGSNDARIILQIHAVISCYIYAYCGEATNMIMCNHV